MSKETYIDFSMRQDRVEACKSGRVLDLPAADEEAKIRAGIAGDADTWALTDNLEKAKPLIQ